MHGFDDPIAERMWRKHVQGKARNRRLKYDAALAQMLRKVAQARRVPLNDLFDDDTSAAVSYARHVGMYLAHVGMGRSQRAVGIVFGRSASTVSYACRRVEELRDNPLINAEIETIERAVRLTGQADAH